MVRVGLTPAFTYHPCSWGMTFSAIVGLVTGGIFDGADGN
jgi:hypothetical protein